MTIILRNLKQISLLSFGLFLAILFSGNPVFAQNSRLDSFLRRQKTRVAQQIENQVPNQQNQASPSDRRRTQKAPIQLEQRDSNQKLVEDPKQETFRANAVQSFIPILDISTDIQETSKSRPENRPLMVLTSGNFESKADWPDRVVTWAAPNIRYQPLYFENVASERYGQTRGSALQTALNTVHFFGSLVTLPKQWIQQPPFCYVSPIGYCRPGNLAPYTRQPILRR